MKKHLTLWNSMLYSSTSFQKVLRNEDKTEGRLTVVILSGLQGKDFLATEKGNSAEAIEPKLQATETKILQQENSR